VHAIATRQMLHCNTREPHRLIVPTDKRGWYVGREISRVRISDHEFLAEFESASISREQWTHRAHVRTAYLYVRRLPFQEALDRLRGGIKALNHANGVADTPTAGYHETLTVAWARVIAAALPSPDPAQDFDSFAQRHPDLLRKDLLQQYYSMERMFAAEARASFVEPDLTPLPQSGTVVRAKTLEDV
jgi:hypothetical protein